METFNNYAVNYDYFGIDTATSCCKDDAVRYLIERKINPIKAGRYSQSAQDTAIEISLFDELQQSHEDANTDLQNAKFDLVLLNRIFDQLTQSSSIKSLNELKKRLLPFDDQNGYSEVKEKILEQANIEKNTTFNFDLLMRQLKKEFAENITRKKEALQISIQQTTKAHQYLCLIDDELAKGDHSQLRIDHLATVNPSYPYITIASLNKWSSDELSINFFDSSTELTSEVDDQLSETKATNLMITLALLVDEFYEKTGGPKYGDKLNVSGLACQTALKSFQ
jgi:hypothetical protein